MAKYSREFKEEALKLSDEIGVKKAASQLGIPYYTLADWRNRTRDQIMGQPIRSVQLFPRVLKTYRSDLQYHTETNG